MCRLLRRVDDIQVAGESRTSNELLESIGDGLQIDVILIALAFPELTRVNYQQIKDLTGAKILVMACLEVGICPSNAIQRGADGYLLEDACLYEMVFAKCQIDS